MQLALVIMHRFGIELHYMPCLYHSLEREWEDLVHLASTQALGNSDVSDIEMEKQGDY